MAPPLIIKKDAHFYILNNYTIVYAAARPLKRQADCTK